MTVFEDLKWRGLIKDISSPELEEKLNKGGMSFYIGTDPTADSLHVGHLSSFLISKRLKDAGHHPYLLVGGGTGLIGDPRPTKERAMISKEAVNKNFEGIKNQVQRLFGFDVVNNYDEAKLSKIFKIYGEEKNANRIARKIVEQRSVKPIETTLELANLIDLATPYKDKRSGGHPAKKVFQAIRIEVNNELEELEQALKTCLKLLNVDGRMCVISFHSLEDRIVKNIFKKYSEVDELVSGLKDIPKEYQPLIKLVNKKPILPSEEELLENSRSRSAKLRIIERI